MHRRGRRSRHRSKLLLLVKIIVKLMCFKHAHLTKFRHRIGVSDTDRGHDRW